MRVEYNAVPGPQAVDTATDCHDLTETVGSWGKWPVGEEVGCEIPGQHISHIGQHGRRPHAHRYAAFPRHWDR